MDTTSVISTLENYKKLTEDRSNQKQLLKEKTIILYVATLLESSNRRVLGLCLDILHNFAQNEKSHVALVATFGIFEALESLAIRLRHSRWASLEKRVTQLLDVLRDSLAPAYNTRGRKRNPKKVTFVYLLYIEELTKDNHAELKQLFVRTEGLISFVVDLEKRQCTVRVDPRLTLWDLAARLKVKLGLTAFLVSRNAAKQEVLTNILEQDTSYFTENYPEVESPSGSCVEHAIKPLEEVVERKQSFMKTISNLWTKSFYW